jgi:hypothetical protein
VRRYTLWHHALLGAFESPFLSSDPGARVDIGDLLIALNVCRTSWPRRPASPVRAMLAHPTWPLRLRRPGALVRHSTVFVEWLHSHHSGPLFWSDSSRQAGGLTAPDVYSLVYGLTSKAGLSQREAWDSTPGQAQTILGAVAELEGAQIQFADPADCDPATAPIQPSDRDAVYQDALAALGPTRADSFIENWDLQHNGRR